MSTVKLKMPNRRKPSHLTHTTIVDDNGLIKMSYHRTQVVSIDPRTNGVHLQTGGWDTVTTRKRMNQMARYYGLAFGVYRDKGQTFVHNVRPDGVKEQFELDSQLLFTSSKE